MMGPFYGKVGANGAALQNITTAALVLISVAQNVNGIWLRTANIVAADAGVFLLKARATAPTDVNGLTLLIAKGAEANLPYPLFIPPGLAVWGKAGTGSASGQAHVTWDPL